MYEAQILERLPYPSPVTQDLRSEQQTNQNNHSLSTSNHQVANSTASNSSMIPDTPSSYSTYIENNTPTTPVSALNRSHFLHPSNQTTSTYSQIPLSSLAAPGYHVYMPQQAHTQPPSGSQQVGGPQDMPAARCLDIYSSVCPSFTVIWINATRLWIIPPSLVD